MHDVPLTLASSIGSRARAELITLLHAVRTVYYGNRSIPICGAIANACDMRQLRIAFILNLVAEVHFGIYVDYAAFVLKCLQTYSNDGEAGHMSIALGRLTEYYFRAVRYVEVPLYDTWKPGLHRDCRLCVQVYDRLQEYAPRDYVRKGLLLLLRSILVIQMQTIGIEKYAKNVESLTVIVRAQLLLCHAKLFPLASVRGSGRPRLHHHAQAKGVCVGVQTISLVLGGWARISFPARSQTSLLPGV